MFHARFSPTHAFKIFAVLIFELMADLAIGGLRLLSMLWELMNGRQMGLVKPRNVLGCGAIILIHGANMDRWCMGLLKWRLARKGWGPLYDFQLGPLTWTLEENAQLLKKACEQIVQVLPSLGMRPTINLIAHSMGGLVARYLLQELQPEAPQLGIVSLITLGTPFRGTPLAYLALSRSGRQMIPGSEFLKRLDKHEKALPRNLRYSHLWGDLDFIVPPRWGYCQGKPCFSLLPYHGHMMMLLTRRAFRLIEPDLVRSPFRAQASAGGAGL